MNDLRIAEACRPIEESCTPRQELQTLYECARTLASRQSQKAMLRTILRVIEDRLGMMRGTVMMLSSDHDELVLELHSSQSPTEANGESQAPRYKRGEGILGEVMRTGRSAVVPRVTEEPRFRNRIHW